MNIKKVILDYISLKYPHLMPLYKSIYNKKDKSYWYMLDKEIKEFADQEGFIYVCNDDTISHRVCQEKCVSKID